MCCALAVAVRFCSLFHSNPSSPCATQLKGFFSRTCRHAAFCRMCLKLSFVPRREQHNQGSVLFKDHNVGRSYSPGLQCSARTQLAEVMRSPTLTPQPFPAHSWCGEETRDGHFTRWVRCQRWTGEDISRWYMDLKPFEKIQSACEGKVRGGRTHRAFMFKQVKELFYCNFWAYWKSCERVGGCQAPAPEPSVVSVG